MYMIEHPESRSDSKTEETDTDVKIEKVKDRVGKILSGVQLPLRKLSATLFFGYLYGELGEHAEIVASSIRI